MTRLAVSLGDPNGIGPEVVRLAFHTLSQQEDVVYHVVSHPVLKREFHDLLQRSDIVWEEVSLDVPFSLSYGEKTLEGGRVAYDSLLRVGELVKQGICQAIVTAPLAKSSVHQVAPHFVDHTTFLASVFGVKEYRMAFWGEKFGVVLETIHVPLSQVVSLLSCEHLERTIRLGWDFCRRLYGEKSYLALCGINPHAGEDGLFGDEEERILRPVVEKIRLEGIPLDGPLPADTVFYHAFRGRYQVVIAMYHDQGLAPFKMVSFENGVNITLGLPVIRTSPDHGTAFDIVGRSIASAKSMKNALEIALRLTRTL